MGRSFDRMLLARFTVNPSVHSSSTSTRARRRSISGLSCLVVSLWYSERHSYRRRCSWLSSDSYDWLARCTPDVSFLHTIYRGAGCLSILMRRRCKESQNRAMLLCSILHKNCLTCSGISKIACINTPTVISLLGPHMIVAVFYILIMKIFRKMPDLSWFYTVSKKFPPLNYL